MADDDEIYVDVVPRLDEAAAEKVRAQLDEKLKDAGDKAGASLSERLTQRLKGVGEKVGDAFSGGLIGEVRDKVSAHVQQGGSLSDVLHDSLTDAMSDKFGKKVGGELADAITKEAKDRLGDFLGTDVFSEKVVGKRKLKTDWLGDQLGSVLGKTVGHALTVSLHEALGKSSKDLFNAVGALGSSSSGTGTLATIGDLVTGLGDVGQHINPPGEKTQRALAALSHIGAGLGGAADLLDSLSKPPEPGKGVLGILGDVLQRGAEGAAVAGIVGNVLDVTGVPEVIGALLGGGGALLNDVGVFPHAKPGSQPLYDPTGRYIGPGARPASQSGIYDAGGAYLLPGAKSAPFAGAAALSATAGGNDILAGVDLNSGLRAVQARSGGTTSAEEVSVQSSVATVSAGAVTLGGSVSIPGVQTSLDFAHSPAAATPETSAAAPKASSGARAPKSKSSSTDLGPGGWITGGMGFATGGTVPDFSGTLPGSSPGHDNILGVLPGGSAVGLEGGEGVIRPRVMQQPGMAALVARLNRHYDSGGIVAPPTQPGTPSFTGSPGSSYAPKSAPQIGAGPGVGVTGGGIIGLGEQAAAMAAGAMTFGGGAVAAQVAEQEMNLAVQKGGQIAATLAAAPLETTWLAGGQLGAPSVGGAMGGWAGKLLSGLIGSQFNAPNIAGATEPPKQARPAEEEGDAEEPLAAQRAPSGSQDDPMHVKVTNPAPKAPQGQATSQSNMGGYMAPITA